MSLNKSTPRPRQRQPNRLARKSATPVSRQPAAAVPQTLIQQAQLAPHSLSPAASLRLQRSIGNRALTQMLGSQPQVRRSGLSPRVQRKGGHLPNRAAINEAKPAEITTENQVKEADALDAIWRLINHYNTQVGDNDYDFQLYALNLMQTKIEEWEALRGGTTKKDNLWNKAWQFVGSTLEDRRLKVDAIKQAIAQEAATVRQQGFDAARIKHQADRDKLGQYLQNGWTQKTDRRLKNSCEWILTGRAKLYAATPTGDAYARLKKRGMDPTRDQAFFPEGLGGAGEIGAAPVYYNKDNLSDQTNVTLYPGGRTTGGWNGQGYIAVVDAANKTEVNVWENLRHEVQHDADMNRGRDSRAGVHQAATNYYTEAEVDFGFGPTLSISTNDVAEKAFETETALQRYKTEYRAYSYQEGTAGGPYSLLDNRTQNKQHDGQNFTERQLAIFQHIYANYDYTKKAWDDNAVLADGTAFRQAVTAYWNPDTEGFNKYNSLRVDDFYQALDAIGPKGAKNRKENEDNLDITPVTTKETDKNAQAVKTLLAAVNKLSNEDADYLLHESPAMDKKIKAHLDGEALTTVQQALSAKYVPDQMENYL